jgi:hypothetical protein
MCSGVVSYLVGSNALKVFGTNPGEAIFASFLRFKSGLYLSVFLLCVPTLSLPALLEKGQKD